MGIVNRLNRNKSQSQFKSGDNIDKIISARRHGSTPGIWQRIPRNHPPQRIYHQNSKRSFTFILPRDMEIYYINLYLEKRCADFLAEKLICIEIIVWTSLENHHSA